ncbi:Ketosamine-3-kinase [Dactylella cylindrospora]|nr:Ketosamine-3-kinase [Dactylella cylindrospora]
MTRQRDEALAAALNLDPENTSVSKHGGSGFASTLKVKSGDKQFFVKTGIGDDARIMFEGEYESLNAINSVVPDMCPRAIAHGALGNGSYFLATEFLEFGGGFTRGGGSSSGDSLSMKLAKLHSQPAPSDGKYGFPTTTCCGSTAQDNTYESTWPSFFINRRLLPILQSCIASNGSEPDLTNHVNRTIPIARYLLSRLSPEASKPVVIHGDLWAGNQSHGSIPPRIPKATPVVFDPSGCYAPAEYDHGIMTMFGGFDRMFWKEYEETVPKGEPVEEYKDRVELYRLYHYLNHYALFGGGYKSSAVGIMQELQAKYGGKVKDDEN